MCKPIWPDFQATSHIIAIGDATEGCSFIIRALIGRIRELESSRSMHEDEASILAYKLEQAKSAAPPLTKAQIETVTDKLYASGLVSNRTEAVDLLCSELGVPE